jgi:hypothetical protein
VVRLGEIPQSDRKRIGNGSFSADQAAQALGISKQAILKRYQKGQIIAWREERQNAVRFPVWQFSDQKVLDGIEETLKILNAAHRLDDFGRVLFLLSNHGFLGGKRPIDCLRDGEGTKVLQAAQGYVGSTKRQREALSLWTLPR